MLALALALGLTMISDAAIGGWAHFSASYRYGTVVEVEIGTKDSRVTPVAYYIRRTIKRPDVADEVAEADSRTCPAIRGILESMEKIPGPRLVAPFLDQDGLMITTDGVGYELTAPSQYRDAGEADMTIRSNVGTPLANWVDESLKALAPCLPPAQRYDR